MALYRDPRGGRSRSCGIQGWQIGTRRGRVGRIRGIRDRGFPRDRGPWDQGGSPTNLAPAALIAARPAGRGGTAGDADIPDDDVAGAIVGHP